MGKEAFSGKANKNENLELEIRQNSNSGENTAGSLVLQLWVDKKHKLWYWAKI